jgi:hypothetical protein
MGRVVDSRARAGPRVPLEWSRSRSHEDDLVRYESMHEDVS